jgi:uncharacterized transporter YbjL
MSLWIVFVAGVGIAGGSQLFWTLAHREQSLEVSRAGGIAGFVAFLQVALVGGAVVLALDWLVSRLA